MTGSKIPRMTDFVCLFVFVFSFLNKSNHAFKVST